MANIVTLPVVYVDGQVLTASDLNSNFVTLNSATIPVTNGGTGLTVAVVAGVLYGVSTSSSAYTSAGSATTVLHGSATVPAFSAVIEADLSLTDNVTANVATTKHGFAPKLPNDATKYLDGTGAYTTPSGTVPAMTLNTVSDVEATTTSNAGTALKNIAITSVPTTSSIIVDFLIRKAAGAADGFAGSIGVNGGTMASTYRTWITNNNAIGTGRVRVHIGPQVANYGGGVSIQVNSYDGSETDASFANDNAQLPIAAITSVQIYGKNAGNVIVIGVAQVKIYTQAGA